MDGRARGVKSDRKKVNYSMKRTIELVKALTALALICGLVLAGYYCETIIDKGGF